MNESDAGIYSCVRKNVGGSVAGFINLQYHQECKINREKRIQGSLVKLYLILDGFVKHLRVLLTVFSFLLIGVLIMFSFFMFYLKKYRVTKEMLTESELKLFMEGDPGAIDQQSTLQEQVPLDRNC